MPSNLQIQSGGQHINQWPETIENVSEMTTQPSAISNTIIGSNPPDTQIEMMTNTNQVITRNETDNRIPDQNPPQVRKISRFQVSHVKEEDKSCKLPNIIHGGDVLLENILPEQKSTPLPHELVTHNIQSPVDNSPDKHEPMVSTTFNHTFQCRSVFPPKLSIIIFFSFNPSNNSHHLNNNSSNFNKY